MRGNSPTYLSITNPTKPPKEPRMSEFNPLLQVGICEEIGESAADIDNLLAELGA